MTAIGHPCTGSACLYAGPGSASTCMLARPLLVHWLSFYLYDGSSVLARPLAAICVPARPRKACNKALLAYRLSLFGSSFQSPAAPEAAAARRGMRLPGTALYQPHEQHAQCALRLARVPCSSRPSAAQSNPPLQHPQKPVPKRSLFSAHGLSLPTG